MNTTTNSITKITGFTPYVIVIALNALTDLGHKILIQNTIFTTFDGHLLIVLTSVVNAFILLPFVCFFSAAGFLSDTVSKTRVLQISALCSLALTVVITVAYFQGWFFFAFICTLLLATQSAFFSPAKYGLIKELFGSRNIIAGNGVVQAVTICAILLSSLLFSVLFAWLLEGHQVMNADDLLPLVAPIGFVLIGFALLEVIISRKLPSLQPANTSRFDVPYYLKLGYLKTNLQRVHSHSGIWCALIALAVFWGVSQVIIAVFGSYIKDHFAINSVIIVQGVMALAALGMVVGSLLFARSQRAYTYAEYVLLAVICVAITLLVIATTSSVVTVAMMFFCYGVAAAYIMVPLNAYVQERVALAHLGSTLAASNFYQNLFMLFGLVITALVAWYDMDAHQIIWFLTLFVVVCAGLGIYLVPQALLRALCTSILRLAFAVRAVDLPERNAAVTNGTLLLGNHVSFLDWALIQLAYKTPVRFVMDKAYYNRWYLRPVLRAFGVIAISRSGSKDALQAIYTALKQGDTVALFPEGCLTRTGHLNQFKPGFVRAVAETGARIVPFYIDGAWETAFSHAGGLLSARKNRRFIVYFGAPLADNATPEQVQQAVHELSVDAWHNRAKQHTITQLWLKQKHTRRPFLIADSTGVELSFSKHMALSCTLASALKQHLQSEQYAALLLPNAAGTTAVGMASLLLGKCLFPLNYTSDVAHLIDALKRLQIRTLVTSKLFIKKLESKQINIAPLLAEVEVVYLEDIRATISKARFVTNWLAALVLPAGIMHWCYVAGNQKTNERAVVLASSGSESAPKIIELTHANIIANATQAEHLLKPIATDVIVGTLPLFHAFGTTACFFLPMVAKVSAVYHPDPTDALGVAKLTARYKGSVLFGTNTFFRLYTRNTRVQPLMFASVRLAIAGAEKLQETVRTSFQLRFGTPVHEGYGVTEASPVIAVNVPDALDTTDWQVQQGSKHGTVGRALPGTLVRAFDPETYAPCAPDEAGMLAVTGAQVMRGYFADKPKTDSVIVRLDGKPWYLTGDKGAVDEQGFVTILDRYSRFAKIGGEMISLGGIERTLATHLTETIEVCAVAVPDEKKGERIILLYAEGSEEEVAQAVSAAALLPLATPSAYQKVDSIPKLGSGKTDLSAAKRLATDGHV